MFGSKGMLLSNGCLPFGAKFRGLAAGHLMVKKRDRKRDILEKGGGKWTHLLQVPQRTREKASGI